MYNLSYFKEEDKEVLKQFIKDYPFAFLTGSDSEGNQVATQIPFLLDERDGEWFLQGHIMRNTDHHKALLENPKILVVFTGPQAYVSATWYTNPQIGSTWNYMSIHASGGIEFMSDDQLITLMKKLTLHFEKGNASSPTVYNNLPDDFLKRMLPAIVGFEVKVDKLNNVFKLSQNRDEASFDNIISMLKEQGGTSKLVANEMEKRRAKLFPPGVEWDESRFLS